MQMLNDEIELSTWRDTVDRLLGAADRREEQLAEAWDEAERLRLEVERLQAKVNAVRLVVASQAETGHLDRADVIAALDVEPSQEQGMGLAAAADNTPPAASRTRGSER